MRSRHWFIAFVLGLGLTMASLWLLSQPVAVRADAGLRFVAPDGNDATDCSSYAQRCRTVQRAINVAAPLDEIRVATGVYTETDGAVAEIHKTVQLLGGWNSTFSARDPDAYPTVLDAERRGRVISIDGTISPTIDGFVITGGNAHNEPWNRGGGGGICSIGASPIIQNNVITNNIAYMGDEWLTSGGGGLYLVLAGPSTVVRGNRVLSNTASTTARGAGGGLFMTESSGLVTGNEICGNVGGGAAGGVYTHVCDAVTFDGNVVIHNTATIGPEVSGGGGGFYLDYTTSFSLINNIIAHNSATGTGGGVFIFGYGSSPSSGTLVNNTVADNLGTDGIRANNDVTLTLTNNIVANHARGIATSGATISATHTLFFNNTSGDIQAGPKVVSTNAITGTEPLFVNPAQDDYHLQENSPAVDAGHPAGVPPAPPTDIDGDPRPIGPRVDIGADEVRLWEIQARIYLPIVLRKQGP